MLVGRTNRREFIAALGGASVWPLVVRAREADRLNGNDPAETFHQAAGYVDRVLRGAKPAELPIQLPSKFELAINIKTAEAMGIKVPPSLLAAADAVIE